MLSHAVFGYYLLIDVEDTYTLKLFYIMFRGKYKYILRNIFKY